MQEAIVIKDISKKFYLRQTKRLSFFKGLIASPEYFRQQKELWALRDINLKVDDGECIGLIGRNGSGKSTLLRIIEGIYTPTSGEVLLKYETGYLQLGLGFNPELSVGENVFLHGAVMGLDRKKLEDCFDDIIAFAELEEFTEAKLRTLSSGMVQRLAFSTTMRTEARILLLDEVFSVGDEIFVKKCKKAMEEFKSQGRTIVFASHQLSTIAETCTNVLVLHEGRQLFYGSVKEALETYDRTINTLNP